jgi:hypothetical protein
LGAVKLADGPSAELRLEELGLSIAVVKEALLTGHGDGRQYGPPYPRFVAGSVAWSGIGVRLIDLLAAKGWEGKEVQGQLRIWSTDLGVTIIPQRGDDNVGIADPDVVPSQRNKKGPITKEAIERNYAASLFDGLEDEEQPTSEAWILLYAFGEESIRAELSWPDDFSQGRVTSWAERIIIPEIPFEGAGALNLDLPNDLPNTGIDFDIERRAA